MPKILSTVDLEKVKILPGERERNEFHSLLTSQSVQLIVDDKSKQDRFIRRQRRDFHSLSIHELVRNIVDDGSTKGRIRWGEWSELDSLWSMRVCRLMSRMHLQKTYSLDERKKSEFHSLVIDGNVKNFVGDESTKDRDSFGKDSGTGMNLHRHWPCGCWV